MKAIEALELAAHILGGNFVSMLDADEADRAACQAREALTAAILSRLGEAQGAPSGPGYSRAEPSGLGPEAEYPSRGWRPIDQKPEDADWIVYLPDGAEDGLGWALDTDERLAALLWWEATGPGRSEITHFREPIAGPLPPAQEIEAEGQDAKGGLVHESPVAKGHAPALTEAGRLAIKDA